MRPRSALRETVSPLKSSKAITVVRIVYEWVESALWAGLTAFLVYFLLYIAPHLPEIRRRIENIRIMQNTAEDSSYCEKWGMKRGTHEHTLCTMDLKEIRQKIEQDFSDQVSLL